MKFESPALLAGWIGLLVFLTGCNELIAQPFQWKLAVDDQFDVTYIQKSTSSTQVSDRTTVIESETELEMTWTIKEVDQQQNAIIEQSLTAIRLEVGNPAVPAKRVSLDTRSKQPASRMSAPILKQVKPLLGLKFDVTMTPRGEIQDVSIPDETMDVLRELPGSLNLQSLFSEQGLTELMGAAAVVLPEKELKPGGSWNSESVVENQFGQFKRVRRYTYPGNDDQPNQVVFTMTTTMDPIGDATSPDTPQLIEFSESGKMQLDASAGYFVSSDIQSSSKTEMPYREKKIFTSINGSILMSIEKK